MKTAMNKQIIAACVRSTLTTAAGLLLSAVLGLGCSQVEGSRCNPDLSHDECDNSSTTFCIQNNTPGCAGEAYCCLATDPTDPHTITSTDPNCAYIKGDCTSSPTYVGSE
jgi:hypothetical protein